MNKTAYKQAEIDQRAKECGRAWLAAFEACVVSREPDGRWVWVDRDRPEWAEVKRIGEKTRKKPARPASRGLGDTIAKITSAVGIKPCGRCKKRQEALNAAVPYGSRGS